jgi:hypothetical protein
MTSKGWDGYCNCGHKLVLAKGNELVEAKSDQIKETEKIETLRWCLVASIPADLSGYDPEADYKSLVMGAIISKMK